MTNKVAFKCRNCGCLEIAANAGELNHPTACRICGKGVIQGYDPMEAHKLIVSALNDGGDPVAVAKTLHDKLAALPKLFKLDPDNWIVLADETEPHKHGLTAEQIERHVPVKATGPPAAQQQAVFVTTSEGGEVATTTKKS